MLAAHGTAYPGSGCLRLVILSRAGDAAAVSAHKAIISWKRTSPDFLTGKYSREHTWTFDGGITVAASPSPSVVPVPYSNPANVDLEEAFVAAVSSCHMLTYLHLASRQGFQIDSYQDEAFGEMAKNEMRLLRIDGQRIGQTVYDQAHQRIICQKPSSVRRNLQA